MPDANGTAGLRAPCWLLVCLVAFIAVVLLQIELPGKEAIQSEASQLAQLRIPPIPGQEAEKPSCKMLPTSPSNTEFAEHLTVTVSKHPVTYVYFASAGSTLVLSPIKHSAVNYGSISVTISSKSSQEGPFSPICRTVRISANGASVLEARAPKNLPGSVWRVEMVLGAHADPDGVPIFFELRREPNSDFDPLWSRLHGPWNDALGYLCINADAQASFSRTRWLSGFGGRVRLVTDTEQSAVPLNIDQQQALHTLILRAVSLWVTSCAACRIEHLAVVQVDKELFFREGVANWLRDEWMPKFQTDLQSSDSTRHFESSLKQDLESSQLLQAGKPTGEPLTKKTYAQYVPARLEDFATFCKVKLLNALTPVLWNVQAALCAPDTLDTASRANIRVRFRDGATACGDSANIIACRADLELTEYNARDFTFVFDDAAHSPIGHGPLQVSLLHVIMHEMGHWIGLSHIENHESIMASGLDHSRCIDAATVNGLRGQRQNVSNAPSAFTMYSGNEDSSFSERHQR
jgi:hypothetical protein